MIELGLIGAALTLFALWAYKPRKSFSPPKTQPLSKSAISCFEAAPSLFVNRSEAALFAALRAHMPGGFYIMTKVRLEDILRVKPSIKDAQLRWHMRGRVKSRHIDFVVMHKSGKPVIAIELDGSVHVRAEASRADAVKDALFKGCGVPLIRITTGEAFDTAAQRIAMQASRLNLAA